MFNQILNSILENHPLLGLEEKDQNKGHLSGLKAPDWVNRGAIYEIFVRNFSAEGSFVGVRDKIPYLKDLGIRTIWLMPIYPIGQKDRKGTLGSPYSIVNYSAIDPAHGTPDDLKSLIKTAHQNGMRVILDMVANHMAVDNIWRDTNPDFFIKDDEGIFTRKISDWSDVIDLDYANREIREKMRSIICSWVRKFDIDGFRCDVAGLVPTDFWEDVYSDLSQIKDDIFMLAEWESAGLHTGLFHATYDWSTHFVLKDIYQGKQPATDAMTWVIEKEANYPRNALPLRFTENHDLNRTRDSFGEEHFYPFVVFNFLMYGIPLIYCGQEFGLKKAPNLFENDPIDWDKFDEQIFGFYKNLIMLRKKYPAFSARKLKNIGNDKPDQIVSILKGDNESKILAILNFSSKEMLVNVAVSDDYHNSSIFDDIYSGSTVRYAELEHLVLKPYSFYLLKLKN
jgi:glycosidase